MSEFFGGTLPEKIIEKLGLDWGDLVEPKKSHGILIPFDTDKFYWRNFITCGACHEGFKHVSSFFKNEYFQKSVTIAIDIGCGFYLNETVCQGAVGEMAPIVFNALSDLIVTPEFMCSRFLGVCENPTFETLTV
jgi:hypothetical protein